MRKYIKSFFWSKLIISLLAALIVTGLFLAQTARAQEPIGDGTYYYPNDFLFFLSCNLTTQSSVDVIACGNPWAGQIVTINPDLGTGLPDETGVEFDWVHTSGYKVFLYAVDMGGVYHGSSMSFRVRLHLPTIAFFRNPALWYSYDGVVFYRLVGGGAVDWATQDGDWVWTTGAGVPDGVRYLGFRFEPQWGTIENPAGPGIANGRLDTFRLANVQSVDYTPVCSLVENAHFTDTTPTDWLVPGDNLATGNWLLQNGAVISDSNLILGLSDSASQKIGAILPNANFQTVISVSNTIGTPRLRVTLANGSQIIEVTGSGRYTTTLTSPQNVGQAVLMIDNVSSPPGESIAEIDFLCISSGGPTGGDCELVPNSDFDDSSSWSLYQSSIASGDLTLNPFGTASQNINLSASTSYGGVISITQVLTSTSSPVLLVTVGSDVIPINLDDAGDYQFSVDTPASLPPVVEFGLSNQNLATIQVGSICIYIGATSQGCLAPLNGNFDTASDWQFMREATWYSPAKEAAMPASTVALLVSSSVYSLPTLDTGENLLLSFTSRKLSDDTGGVMGRVKGVSGVNFTYEVYPIDYIFETSLNSLAGEESVEVSFVNPGLEGSTIFSSTADIALDNVCIFVTNRGPNLPTPTDPNAIPGVDLGVNWTSCLVIDGILAGFGVNMAQYRAEYEAGASVWDPAGWVPWLVSAMWVTLVTYLCVFMAAFVTLVDIFEYLINNFLNIGNWVIRNWPATVIWLTTWFNWGVASLSNLSSGYGLFFVNWAIWGGLGLLYIAVVIGLILTALGGWFGLSLDNIFTWLGSTIAALWAWLSTYLFNLNGLRTIINWLIAGWNLFIDGLGVLLSSIIDLAVWVWNYGLFPIVQAVWDYLSGFSLIALIVDLVIDFVVAAFNLFWMVSQWVWENVFMVVSLPFQIYYGFTEGTQSAAFDALIACSGENWFCKLLAGLQIINQTVGATILYPIVIAGIIIATIGIFGRSIWKMFTIEIA